MCYIFLKMGLCSIFGSDSKINRFLISLMVGFYLIVILIPNQNHYSIPAQPLLINLFNQFLSLIRKLQYQQICKVKYIFKMNDILYSRYFVKLYKCRNKVNKKIQNVYDIISAEIISSVFLRDHFYAFFVDICCSYFIEIKSGLDLYSKILSLPTKQKL